MEIEEEKGFSFLQENKEKKRKRERAFFYFLFFSFLRPSAASRDAFLPLFHSLLSNFGFLLSLPLLILCMYFILDILQKLIYFYFLIFIYFKII